MPGVYSNEMLHHFNCEKCKHWWCVADAHTKVESVPLRYWFCPWCGHRQRVEKHKSTTHEDPVVMQGKEDMSNINERLKEGVSKEELLAIVEKLPTGCDLRINRNMLFVSHDGNLKSIDQATEGIPEQQFEIWMEDHNATGSRSDATRLGTARGRTFREAVLAYFRTHPSNNFNPETLTEWGRKLYPNEEDARKSFG